MHSPCARLCRFALRGTVDHEPLTLNHTTFLQNDNSLSYRRAIPHAARCSWNEYQSILQTCFGVNGHKVTTFFRNRWMFHPFFCTKPAKELHFCEKMKRNASEIERFQLFRPRWRKATRCPAEKWRNKSRCVRKEDSVSKCKDVTS